MRPIAQAVCLLLGVWASIVATPVLAVEEPTTATADPAPSEPARTNRVVFSCPKDQRLTVEFRTAGTVEQAVVQPQGAAAVTLPIKMSGSGFRYADETHELRGKGQEVIWTDASKRPIVCTEAMAAPLGTEPK